MTPKLKQSNQPNSETTPVVRPGSLQRLLTPKDRYSGRPIRRVDATLFPPDAPELDETA